MVDSNIALNGVVFAVFWVRAGRFVQVYFVAKRQLTLAALGDYLDRVDIVNNQRYANRVAVLQARPCHGADRVLCGVSTRNGFAWVIVGYGLASEARRRVSIK